MENRSHPRHAEPILRLVLAAGISWGVLLPPDCAAAEKPIAGKSLAADRGMDGDALFTLGQKYLKGDGVPRDGAKVVELMRAAAEKGHAEALAMLGYCYSTGTGVAKDDAKAREFFAQGAAKGSASANGNLGLFLIRGRGGEKEFARGLELMRAAAEQGSQQSAVLLGEIYYMGEHAGGQPDYPKAYEVLLKPAEVGNAAAQNMIGVMLKDARLGTKDADAARVWFEKAAFQGNGKACVNLAEQWNHQSSDRSARIEALRWLLVGDALHEAFAGQFLRDIESRVAPDEMKAARQLAEFTQRMLLRRP